MRYFEQTTLLHNLVVALSQALDDITRDRYQLKSRTQLLLYHTRRSDKEVKSSIGYVSAIKTEYGPWNDVSLKQSIVGIQASYFRMGGRGNAVADTNTPSFLGYIIFLSSNQFVATTSLSRGVRVSTLSPQLQQENCGCEYSSYVCFIEYWIVLILL